MARGRGDTGTDCARLILYLYIILIFVTGIGCFVVGIWMSAAPYPSSYFMIMRAGEGDETLIAGAALLIVAGIILCVVGVIGIFGLSKESKNALMLFIGLLLLIMLLQLVVGFMAVVFKDEIHKYVKDGMRSQLQNDYEFDNSKGKAWNFVQVRHKCCGADGSIDYRFSEWWYAENPGIENNWEQAEVHVPPTCCRLQSHQERDVRHVDPQDAKPEDNTRCQFAARGSQDAQNYHLRNKGCFTALLEVVFYHINALLGIGIAVGFIQIVGIACAFYIMRNMNQTPEKAMHMVVQ